MNYISQQITFREIPDEVCLSFLIAGCPVHCPDCNSKDSWFKHAGQLLTGEKFQSLLLKKKDWITCVLFLGGEWEQENLQSFLKIAQQQNLKTALFTGLDQIDPELQAHLDYLKTGPYLKELGGLESPRTNQVLINLKTGKKLSPFKEEYHHDPLK